MDKARELIAPVWGPRSQSFRLAEPLNHRQLRVDQSLHPQGLNSRTEQRGELQKSGTTLQGRQAYGVRQACADLLVGEPRP